MQIGNEDVTAAITKHGKELAAQIITKDVAETDMICGGDVDIFLEPLSADNQDQIQGCRKILDIQKRGGAGLLVTVVNVDRWQKNIVPRLFALPGAEPTGTSSTWLSRSFGFIQC